MPGFWNEEDTVDLQLIGDVDAISLTGFDGIHLPGAQMV
jgi:hypothetical protein